jgi:plasmid stabilization system protein ParE
VIRAAWHPLAKRELFEAQDFYEARARGVRRFPYSLIYRLDEERLFILVVFHHRKKPRHWAGTGSLHARTGPERPLRLGPPP